MSKELKEPAVDALTPIQTDGGVIDDDRIVVGVVEIIRRVPRRQRRALAEKITKGLP